MKPIHKNDVFRPAAKSEVDGTGVYRSKRIPKSHALCLFSETLRIISVPFYRSYLQRFKRRTIIRTRKMWTRKTGEGEGWVGRGSEGASVTSDTHGCPPVNDGPEVGVIPISPMFFMCSVALPFFAPSGFPNIAETPRHRDIVNNLLFTGNRSA